MQWQGTRDISAWLTVPAAIEFQAKHDWASVQVRCHELASSALEELTKRFGTIVCGAELAHGKPHPMAYLKGLSDLGGTTGLSMAFEDSPAGMASAIAAGMPVAGMTTNLDAAGVLAAGACLAAPNFLDAALLAFVRKRTGRG